MYKETFTAIAILAGLVAGTAQAHTAQRMEARFIQMDTNADGQIAVEELEAQAIARFDAADADRNGALSLEEFAKARGQGKKGHDRKAD
jgi:Ca2+-binding EF-hand superfamily protein